MKSGTVTLVLIVLILIGGIVVYKYNKIASYDEKVVSAWKPLESAIEARYDSIPKLLGAIELYAGRNIPEDNALAVAYPEFAKAKTIEGRARAANRIENTLQQVYQTVAMRYPGISSNTHVMTVANIIKGTREKVSAAASAYNKAAETYNEYIRQFPNDIIAGALGFAKKYEYIQPQF